VSALIVLIALTAGSSRAFAQTRSVEAGGHVAVLRLNEWDTTRVGAEGHVVWPVAPLVAIDGAFTWFPGTGDVDVRSFGRPHLALGLAGIRTGVTHGDVDVFARVRAGFLSFGAQQGLVCIAIFPIPLVCQLSGGYTAFAADLGGGVSVGLARTGRLRASIEAGDLLVRYGLASDRSNGKTTEGFVGHNPLVSIGLAWRF
jgi:hypothetical protein